MECADSDRQVFFYFFFILVSDNFRSKISLKNELLFNVGN